MKNIKTSFKRWSKEQQEAFLERMVQEIPVCIRLIWAIEKSSIQEKTDKAKQLVELQQLVRKRLRTMKKGTEFYSVLNFGAQLGN